MDIRIIYQTIIQQVVNYLEELDWMFIISFIILAYAMNKMSQSKKLPKFLRIGLKTRYRVVIVGLMYALIVFLFRGYLICQLEPLFHSFLFAMVFHQMIIDWFIRQIQKIGAHVEVQ